MLWMRVPGGIVIDSTLLLRSSELRLAMNHILNYILVRIIDCPVLLNWQIKVIYQNIAAERGYRRVCPNESHFNVHWRLGEGTHRNSIRIYQPVLKTAGAAKFGSPLLLLPTSWKPTHFSNRALCSHPSSQILVCYPELRQNKASETADCPHLGVIGHCEWSLPSLLLPLD